MKKTNYSIKKLFRKGIATLLTASMVVTAVQAPAFADNVEEEVTESSASVTGLVHKKITLELVSDELKEAALTAIRENRLFDAQDYLAATGDNQKALREYEAFFNENPGLYVVDAPESVVDTLSGEDAELRIFVQKDAKMAKVDLTASPSEITREDSTESKNVEFRYGTDKDIILYEPASNVDTLVNGGEDAVYIEPEQEIGDNSDYELTGNEKITFMFVNASDSTVKFTLKVDGVTYDKVEVGGREAALKKIIAEAGTKKSTEETTAAETTVAETTEAVTAVTEETTVADETTAAEVQDDETEAPAEETTAEGTEIANADADNVSTETEETTAAVEETAAETEAPAADTDAEVKEEAPAEVTEEPETEATIPEKIAEAISEAFGGASDAVLGRMTVYADTIVGEGVEFEVEENAPAAGDSEEAEDKDTNEVVAEAVEAAAGEDTATEAEEVNEETTAAVEEAADDNTVLAADTTALQIAVSEGLSEDEAENQVEETVAQEVTAVETEPETVAETQAVKETIAKDDETKAAKVATASEITEYDDFALELIAEVKEEVLQDKAAAKENIKVARIAQYTINELGKVHYETEVDGFNVEVFAAKNAFGDITPTLEAKKLAKPEEAETSEDKLSDDQVAELKANDIYDNSQSLDIHFVDGAGNEVEPKESVKVRITVSDEDLLKTIDATSLEVHHLKETDDTLKTEKVADTEDVKLLDKNDEEIKDSDLEANAEAVAAGEDAEVEVASAVAEFEVENFSVFAITWTTGWSRTVRANIEIHYVDEEGNPIKIRGKEVNSRGYMYDPSQEKDSTIILADIEGGITGYTYQSARLNSFDGDVITKLKSKQEDNYNAKYIIEFYNNNQRVKSSQYNNVKNELGSASSDGSILYYYDGDDSELYLYEGYSDWYGLTNDKSKFVPVGHEQHKGEQLYTFDSGYEGYRNQYGSHGYDYWYKQYDGDRYYGPIDDEIYFVYKKTPYTDGTLPDPAELEDITSNKELVSNEDGTYTLTLSVTGNSKGENKDVNANVLIVFDLSNSMNTKHESTDNYRFFDSSRDNNADKYKYENGCYVKFINNWEANAYTGDKYVQDYNATRLELAKVSMCHLVDNLMAINTQQKPSRVQIGLITFANVASSTNKVYSYSDAMQLKKDIKDLSPANSQNVCTNWEDALIKANEFPFDSDPEYVVFVSDGLPSFRRNANGYYDDKYSNNQLPYTIYGSGSDSNGSNVSRCLIAAEAAAENLVNHKKVLFAVDIFGNSTNMKNLVDGDTNYYRSASSQADINSAFNHIAGVISQNLSYAGIEITDGITGLTASTLISGSPNGFTYSVKDANGNDLPDELAKIKTSDYPAEYTQNQDGTSSVVWNIGGKDKKYKLLKGATYSVSFVVWPNQKAYDAAADSANKKPADSTVNYDNYVKSEDGTWGYKTNTVAKVDYLVASEATGETTNYESRTDTIDNPDPIPMIGTNIGIEKVWEMDDITTQKKFIESTEITLDLKRDSSDYISGLTVKSSNDDEEDGNTVTWKSGSKLSIAPGILVQAELDDDGNVINNKYGFDLNKIVTYTYTIDVSGEQKTITEKYFKIVNGHNYSFHEKNDNPKFKLNEKTYHPMLVNDKLYDVEFNGNQIVSMTKMGEKGSEKITAHNELKYTDLTVKKKFRGNMAELKDATFELTLYNLDGTEYTKTSTNDRDDIVELNTVRGENNSIVSEKVTLSEEGVYTFTIAAPEKLGEYNDVSITLPDDILYDVTEVNPIETEGYTPYCGISDDEEEMTATCSTSNINNGKFKLSGEGSVPIIYFINEKEVKTPTGFGDNAIPFVALALTGLASMVFLAYDFQKRRLFED